METYLKGSQVIEHASTNQKEENSYINITQCRLQNTEYHQRSTEVTFHGDET